MKAPEPGKVKTRLIPDLGVEKATEIHTKLVNHVLGVAQSANVDAVQCWITGDQSDAYVQSLSKNFDVHIQNGESLGDRMQYALTQGLNNFEKVVIVGGDAYSLTSDYIEQSCEYLESTDVVLGPAEDGGYILVASATDSRQLFDNIAWGTETVLAEQVRQLESLALTHKLLEERWDIDDINDIKKHAPELLG